MHYDHINYASTQVGEKHWLGCGIFLIQKPNLPGSDSQFRKEGKEIDRIEPTDYSVVEYKFITLFFLPIFPLGCFRIAYLFRQESLTDTTVYRRLVKQEQMKLGEVIYIYLFYYLVLAAFIMLIILI